VQKAKGRHSETRLTWRQVLNRGCKYTKDAASGAAKGAATALLAGVPPTLADMGVSAAVGGLSQIAAASTKHVIEEVANRALTAKEFERVATAAWRIENEFWERIIANERPRDDGFFSELKGDRPAAEELLEGTLYAVRSEYEERKAPYVEHIFANVAFRRDISREAANHFLAIGDSLSYRQVKLLALIKRKDETGFNTSRVFDGPVAKRDDCHVIRQQAKSLVSLELIKPVGDPPKRSVRLDSLGKTLFELMSLDRMPIDELLTVKAIFTSHTKRKR